MSLNWCFAGDPGPTSDVTPVSWPREAGGLFVVLKAVFDVLLISRRLFANLCSGTGWSVTMIFGFLEEKHEEKDIERGNVE